MKKFFLLLFLLPIFALAQTYTTTPYRMNGRELIIIILMLMGSYAFGQSLGQTTIAASYNMATTGDTLIDFPYDMETGSYAWRLDVQWSSVGGTTDGILKVKCTGLPGFPADANWVDYPNMSSVTINSAGGQCSFEDSYLAARRIGILFDKNNITSGTLKVYMTLKPR